MGGLKGEAKMESYGILGIAGALLAGFLGRAIGWYEPNEGAGFVAAIVGAFVILLIYRLVLARRR